MSLPIIPPINQTHSSLRHLAVSIFLEHSLNLCLFMCLLQSSPHESLEHPMKTIISTPPFAHIIPFLCFIFLHSTHHSHTVYYTSVCTCVLHVSTILESQLLLICNPYKHPANQKSMEYSWANASLICIFIFSLLLVFPLKK